MARGIPNKPALDTRDEVVGQQTYVDMPQDVAAKDLDLSEKGAEIIQASVIDDYVAELAFMEEPVLVEILESQDPNAEPVVDVYCQGIPCWMVRGQVHQIKRKFLQILAGARQTSIKTDVRVDGDTVVNRVNKHSALRYPFQVHEDKNPKGREWLRKVLASA